MSIADSDNASVVVVFQYNQTGLAKADLGPAQQLLVNFGPFELHAHFFTVQVQTVH